MTAATFTPTQLTETADRLAATLATPETPPPDEPWTAHSLANGAAGIALLHIERAHAGTGSWRTAHTWIQHATGGDISAADTTGLFLGAPALAFMLRAAAGTSTRYRDALTTLDTHVNDLVHRRADAAMARIRRNERPAFPEYDVFLGLTGIGAHLLRHDPGDNALEGVLTYLVALTRPLPGDDGPLPGWWVDHDQHGQPSPHLPGGHANLGAAHGITGPLMLLSHAARRGITVDGHTEAIDTVVDWLNTWKQEADSRPWWPEVVTMADLRTGRPSQPGPARPSWCYGTPGIARALQLAALATRDTARQRAAEHALVACLSDPAQLAQLVDSGLCHGWAGVYQTAWRAAHDATTPALRALLPQLAAALAHHTQPDTGTDHGFLEGTAGAALALTTAACNTAPHSGWDACLLID